MQRNLIGSLRPLLRGVTFMPKIVPTRMLMIPSLPKYSNKCPTCGKGKLPDKLAKLMKQYQKNDGQPVFLKGGSMDLLLYRITLVLSVIGLLGDFHLFFGYILA